MSAQRDVRQAAMKWADNNGWKTRDVFLTISNFHKILENKPLLGLLRPIEKDDVYYYLELERQSKIDAMSGDTTALLIVWRANRNVLGAERCNILEVDPFLLLTLECATEHGSLEILGEWLESFSEYHFVKSRLLVEEGLAFHLIYIRDTYAPTKKILIGYMSLSESIPEMTKIMSIEEAESLLTCI